MSRNINLYCVSYASSHVVSWGGQEDWRLGRFIEILLICFYNHENGMQCAVVLRLSKVGISLVGLLGKSNHKIVRSITCRKPLYLGKFNFNRATTIVVMHERDNLGRKILPRYIGYMKKKSLSTLSQIKLSAVVVLNLQLLI